MAHHNRLGFKSIEPEELVFESLPDSLGDTNTSDERVLPLILELQSLMEKWSEAGVDVFEIGCALGNAVVILSERSQPAAQLYLAKNLSGLCGELANRVATASPKVQ